MSGDVVDLKVFIVEDSIITADILRDFFLMQWKINPEVFHNGKDFAERLFSLKAAPEQLPDLVVLDIGLPGESGIEIMKKIKSDDVLKNIHVIMNTGSDNLSHMMEIKKWPAVSYLRKGMSHTAALQEVISKLKIQGAFKKA